MSKSNNPKQNITDYDDINYESDFWSDRHYENIIEQSIIKKMLNKSVSNFIDCGAGFGRLVPSYEKIIDKKIVLFDYSKKLLDSAKKKYGDKKNIDFVQGSLYEIPFDDNFFDGGVSVRVLHHVEDVPRFFSELNRVLKNNSVFILEYANKRNVLEITRAMFRRSKLHPFSIKPENRSDIGLTINFHPRYIQTELIKHGFIIEKKVASSIFRLSILKRILGQKFLSTIEVQMPLFMKRLLISPSTFLRIRKVKDAKAN
ncbi:MAG: hypothetical protein A2Y40_02145 [Candidatus Margulisbacteria bacterium GWF2_35_9]|nr:MAG: hypothetical protein A2Y40_02145 [Candidatus Margulisbacteria bacterium GWF2_35_9]